MHGSLVPAHSHTAFAVLYLVVAARALQIAAFFSADGPGVTNPGSLLHLSIYPSYYNAVPRVSWPHNTSLNLVSNATL